MSALREIEKVDNTEENIAALEEKAFDNTDLGNCLLWVLDDARGNTTAYSIAKNAIAELAQLHACVAKLEGERDELKIFCAKAYFDIHGGVRKEIYDALGDELGVLMSRATALEEK